MRIGVLAALCLAAACSGPSVSDLGGSEEAVEASEAVLLDSTGAPCAARTQVVIWGLRQWQTLAESFAAAPGECTEYFISIPPVACEGDLKICPRGPDAPQKIRDLGPQFHAMSEFHWTSWRKWVEANGKTWEQAGREFRKRMKAANYDVAKGDTWSLNELPSTVRTGVGSARTNAKLAVRGLHAGPSGAIPARGAVFVIGMGQQTVNLSVYKPQVKAWLKDDSFWNAMNGRVRFFAQEAYSEPKKVCVAGSTVAARSSHTNDFVEHLARLAAAGGPSTAKARSFFDKAYVPLMNASWGQRDGSGYGGTEIPADEMAKLVAVQTYAVRAWSASHAYPDRRVGFAWAPAAGVTAADLEPIADRMAWSIRDAYAPGGRAIDACNPAGTYSGCQCTVKGATFNEAWKTFGSF